MICIEMSMRTLLWYYVMVNTGYFLLEIFPFNTIKECDNIKRSWGFRYHFFFFPRKNK